jgi:hypothetical protein
MFYKTIGNQLYLQYQVGFIEGKLGVYKLLEVYVLKIKQYEEGVLKGKKQEEREGGEKYVG